MTSLTSLREASTPSVAVDIGAARVSAAAVEWRGRQAVVAAHASEPLPNGAVVPAITAPNIRDRATVAAALGRVFDRIGRPRRVGLVIPDIAARVSLVRFERVPARTQDLDQLVRWQVRKAAPFPIEQAQVSYVPGLAHPDGQEFIVSLARRDVVEEYEQVCADAGAHAGIVDLATFNIVNAVLAGSELPPATAADWLLVNVAPDYASVAILRGPHVIFFRSRGADADATLADLVHQTVMYYEDRLSGGGFGRVILAGSTSVPGVDPEQMRRTLEARLATTIEAIDPRAAAAITDRIGAAPALLDTLAPMIGLLLRDREQAVA